MKIQSSIWGAPGTFPFLLAVACRGEYSQQHQPGVFPEPLARVTKTLELDQVGRSLLFLGSDLTSEAEQKLREANEATAKAGKRFQLRSTRLGHQANAAALAEASQRLNKQHQLVCNLLFAYVRAVTPEFQNGAPSMSFTAESKILVDFDDEQIVDGALPQSHPARQAALYIVRILAGNDDPTQIGIGDELRAYRIGIDESEAAENAVLLEDAEPLAFIEDPALRRLSTLIGALMDADLGIPVTLSSLAEGGAVEKAKEILVDAIALTAEIFHELIGEQVWEPLHERGVAVLALREDWALVNGEELTPRRKAERALDETLERLTGALSKAFSFDPPELDLSEAPPEAIERIRGHVATCKNEGCPFGPALAKFDAQKAAEQQGAEPKGESETSSKEAGAEKPAAES